MVFVLIILVIALLFVPALAGRGEKERFEAFRGVPIAHRGLHNKPQIPENSMPAFSRAVDKGYGIELDLHLLADGGLAVFHDNTLVRTTGAEGRVKDLTSDELKNYRLEGTENTIPAFPEVLKLVDGKVPLIIELKAEGNSAELCKATLKALENYSGAYVIESFDPRPLIWLKNNRPDITRGQLSQNFIKEPSGLKLPLRLVLTSLVLNFLTKPDFIAYNFSHRNNIFNKICIKLWKLQPVVWTIENNNDYKTAAQEGAILIFEQFEPNDKKSKAQTTKQVPTEERAE